jgi:hypothetical protein
MAWLAWQRTPHCGRQEAELNHEKKGLELPRIFPWWATSSNQVPTSAVPPPSPVVHSNFKSMSGFKLHEVRGLKYPHRHTLRCAILTTWAFLVKLSWQLSLISTNRLKELPGNYGECPPILEPSLWLSISSVFWLWECVKRSLTDHDWMNEYRQVNGEIWTPAVWSPLFLLSFPWQRFWRELKEGGTGRDWNLFYLDGCVFSISHDSLKNCMWSETQSITDLLLRCIGVGIRFGWAQRWFLYRNIRSGVGFWATSLKKNYPEKIILTGTKIYL